MRLGVYKVSECIVSIKLARLPRLYSSSSHTRPTAMRVFITGAAGFIGRAVVHGILGHGHSVLGLARSDANAEILSKAGAGVLRGDLEDVESLKSGARATNGIIHLAFIHDGNDFAKAAAIDRAAIAAFGEALAGTGKPLVIGYCLGHTGHLYWKINN